MKRVLLALPLLLGNFPAPCPTPGPTDVVFDGTITSVEKTEYRCVVQPPDVPSLGCIEVWPGHQACAIVIHGPGGSSRTVDAPGDVGSEVCDLTAGHYTIEDCADDVRLSCELDWTGAPSSVLVATAGSLPSRYRIHVRADAPVLHGQQDVVFDADEGRVVGTRWRFTIRGEHATSADAPLALTHCDVAAIPSQHPATRGCAHCAAGDGGEEAYLLAVVVVLALSRRRRIA